MASTPGRRHKERLIKKLKRETKKKKEAQKHRFRAGVKLSDGLKQNELLQYKKNNNPISLTLLSLCIKPPTVPPKKKQKKKLDKTMLQTQHNIYYTT